MRPQAGLLNVNKPRGWTSQGVCTYMKPLLGGTKVGHAGTLDPFAQGVLLVLFGQATKLFPYLQGEKEYEALLRLGQTTETGDLTGRITSEAPFEHLPQERVEEVIAGFGGEVWQRPPRFSALRRGGKRLYDLARQGVEVNPEPRKVWIKEISLSRFALPFVGIRVTCSAGTYIRSLASDIGERLGCGAHLVQLVRTKVENFSVEASLPPERIRELAQGGRWSDFVIPMGDALPEWKLVKVNSSSLSRLRDGLPLRPQDLLSLPPGIKRGERIKVLDEREELVALLRATANIEEREGFQASYLRVLL